jgi:hypothetical protein
MEAHIALRTAPTRRHVNILSCFAYPLTETDHIRTWINNMSTAYHGHPSPPSNTFDNTFDNTTGVVRELEVVDAPTDVHDEDSISCSDSAYCSNISEAVESENSETEAVPPLSQLTCEENGRLYLTYPKAPPGVLKHSY